MAKVSTVPDAVRDVLHRCSVTNNVLRLPDQLDRADYLAVDKVLKGLGGKWNRKHGGHVFPAAFDVSGLVNGASETGSYTDRKKALNFFETPVEFARYLVDLAQIKAGDVCLEPSAGHGAIVRVMLDIGAHVTAVEIDQMNYAELCLRCPEAQIYRDDFMEWSTAKGELVNYDAVIMNPPFDYEIEHIAEAYKLLKLGGRLVSVCSGGIGFRSDKKTTAFRTWLDDIGATITPAPVETFKASGTGVNTMVITAIR